ncbi:MAG: hypothetical protein JSS27_20120 [Planctomycetes bacterium]|nr:hypothetical protein [Planctomycetota bacterium]
MALKPLNEAHALQIQAGTIGRHAGHEFEDHITRVINALAYPVVVQSHGQGHVLNGEPGLLLLHYIGSHLGAKSITSATAISTGSLATSEAGRQWLSVNGVNVSRCKSDLVVTIVCDDGRNCTVGVSAKQCNNDTPTNAQLYFTTAHGFSHLLNAHGLPVSGCAVNALRQFCGDSGFRPRDDPNAMKGREIDPRRFFWEEIDAQGRAEWERLFTDHQDDISRLLFQKAYIDDPFVPEYLLHKTKKAASPTNVEVAIYSIDELIVLSRSYQGYATRPYSVRKGSYKDPEGVTHLAPRFGVIQMQRGGQAQHPEQLQFNLEAGYFYKI